MMHCLIVIWFLFRVDVLMFFVVSGICFSYFKEEAHLCFTLSRLTLFPYFFTADVPFFVT